MISEVRLSPVNGSVETIDNPPKDVVASMLRIFGDDWCGRMELVATNSFCVVYADHGRFHIAIGVPDEHAAFLMREDGNKTQEVELAWILVPECQVVDFDSVQQCVMHFLEHEQRPQGLQWAARVMED
jgi:hypothetical protein